MDPVRELLVVQAGVIARWQALALGLVDSDIRRQLRRRDWVKVHPGVYLAHTGTPTWTERAWAAVLFAWPAALCGESALRAAEGRSGGTDGWAHDLIHVAVGRNRGLSAPEGVRLHRMAHLDERVQWNVGPPRLRYEEAALDVAAAATTELASIGVIAGAVQSRRTTATRLLEALARRQRTRRRTWLASVLNDVASGACSALEHGYLHRVERAHGLPRARRQVRAASTLGITYRDVQYDDLVLELDGRLFHDTTQQRDRDIDRDLDAAVERRIAIRLGWGQVFGRPCRTAARLATLLAQRGWTGHPVPCGPTCQVRVGWLPQNDSQPTRTESSG